MRPARSTDGDRQFGAGRDPPAGARIQHLHGSDPRSIDTPRGCPVLARNGDGGGRRLGPLGHTLVERLIQAVAAEVVSFTPDQAQRAIAAFLRYGKGRHPAGLNFGDCCSYALADEAGLPLLFKGRDFARTDIRPAVAP